MNTFSPSDTALEGFQVLRKHWRVVVGWAGFNLLAMIAMVVVTVIVLLALELAGGAKSHPEAAGQVGGLVAGLGYLATEIVIIAGLYRLLLRPEEPGFLHLRIGRKELRVFAGFAAPTLALAPLAFGGAILIGAVLERSVWGAAAMTLILAVGLAALGLRFALTPVIGFAQGGVPLLAAWRMSRGQSWRLIGMTALVACLLAVIGIAIWVTLFVIGGLLTGFNDFGLSGAESLAAHPGRYVFQIVAELVLAPIFLIIAQAPFVAVYRALSAPA
jgi:hypothetical protein